MKIAIQGHPTRAREVAQILESLGGKNIVNHSFIHNDLWYFIDSYNNITYSKVTPTGYKEYTLEEFEKEFPFKVGDLCIYQSEYIGDIKVKVLRMIIQDNDIVYEIGPKDTNKTYSGIYRKRDVLKLYKEMKEERNITLTLDKAKEWYKKGGELREIALQAFTEKELTKIDLPKTWEAFCEKYPIKSGETYVDGNSKFIINNLGTRHFLRDKNICPSQKSAEAHLAMIQLEQLRNCWWGGWEPEWSNCEKYVIKWDKNDLMVFTARNIHAFLVFPTREMAEEFLKCFRDLIEKAGDLI